MPTVPNPMEVPSPPPRVSKKTVHMAGLLVDVYGLAELPPPPPPPLGGGQPTRISCLWLHHPRTRAKEDMADVAARCVDAWNAAARHDAPPRQGRRGLVALAFDQRNHGGRTVSEVATGAWRDGNPTHAQDMFGIVAGTVADQISLLDAVGGYLFREIRCEGGAEARAEDVVIDQHLALGVSLGGHSVWQLMLADPRVSAGVAVIGCPDYMSLLSDRARLSKLSTYTADDGASFLGSRDFPPALIEACKKYDPKALLFGTDHVPPPPPASPTASEQDGRQRLEATLRARVRGKKFLLCSGAEDKVVPYQCGRPFVDWFKGAADAWFGARGEDAIVVRDVLYPGTGHTFSAAMIQDAVRFVVDVVAGGDGRVALAETAGGGEERRVSKI